MGERRWGAERINHPLFGELTFNYEAMDLAADDGLSLIVCHVAHASREADTLKLLASWTAEDRSTQAAAERRS